MPIETIVLVNEGHVVPGCIGSLHENGLPSITIAHPFVEREYPHEIHAIHDPVEVIAACGRRFDLSRDRLHSGSRFAAPTHTGQLFRQSRSATRECSQ